MKKCIFILLIIFTNSQTKAQFIEPGLSFGLNSYSGDLKRGYAPFNGKIGLEIFNRFNISSYQTFKISYKRGSIEGEERINDALSINRNMNFQSKISEISGKFEYNFLDYFDEVTKFNFTPYIFFGIGTTILKNIEANNLKIEEGRNLFLNVPFGFGFKYLINKQFSIAFEVEFKKTFNDKLDYTTGANTTNINNVTGLNFNNNIKNYQYGSGNDNDFYYFTGISLSYILYKIPCPKDSAPYNSIY